MYLHLKNVIFLCHVSFGNGNVLTQNPFVTETKKGVFLRLQKDSDRLSISLIVFDKTSPQKKNN